MARPTSQDFQPTTVDPWLTRIIQAYLPNPKLYNYGRMAPEVPMEDDLSTNSYNIVPQADQFLDDAAILPELTEALGEGFELSESTVTTYPYARKYDISDKKLNASKKGRGGVMDLFTFATNFCINKIALRKERLLALTVFKTGVWDTDVTFTTGTKWSNKSSTPLDQIDEYIRIMVRNYQILREDIHLGLGASAWKHLRRHPQLLDGGTRNGGNTQGTFVSDEQIRDALAIGSVFPLEAAYNSAAAGATASMGSIFNHDSALLYHVPKTPSKLIPSAMYLFNNLAEKKVFNERIPLKGGVRIQAQEEFAIKVTGTGLGVYFDAAITN